MCETCKLIFHDVSCWNWNQFCVWEQTDVIWSQIHYIICFKLFWMMRRVENIQNYFWSNLVILMRLKSCHSGILYFWICQQYMFLTSYIAKFVSVNHLNVIVSISLYSDQTTELEAPLMGISLSLIRCQNSDFFFKWKSVYTIMFLNQTCCRSKYWWRVYLGADYWWRDYYNYMNISIDRK